VNGSKPTKRRKKKAKRREGPCRCQKERGRGGVGDQQGTRKDKKKVKPHVGQCAEFRKPRRNQSQHLEGEGLLMRGKKQAVVKKMGG